jgi:hypothetical protein
LSVKALLKQQVLSLAVAELAGTAVAVATVVMQGLVVMLMKPVAAVVELDLVGQVALAVTQGVYTYKQKHLL